MNWMRIAALATCWAIIPSCSSVEHTRLSSEDDVGANGIRYYGSSLYLLLYSDGKGGIVTELHEYPDQTKLMEAKPKYIAASSNMTLECSNGMLTKTVETGDGTAVPVAVLKAIETVADKTLSALSEAGDTKERHSLPPPYLYKIVADQDGVQFLGGQPDHPKAIYVTLVEITE